MPVVIRMARAGTKKRPFYHIVAADSRRPATAASSSGSATSIRCCRRTRPERLKLDLDKVKAWMAKGAQPSDRVMRFLDAAGIAKREKRNNPEKAIPRKERKAQRRGSARPRTAGRRRGQGRREGQGRRGADCRPAASRDRSGAVADRICVAQIGAAHGIRGEVRLWSFTHDPMAVTDYGPLESEDGTRRSRSTPCGAAKDHFVARLTGVDDRARRRSLRNLDLYVPRDRLPPIEEDDTFYHADLIGLAAVTPDGGALGTVTAIHNFGAGDLVEIQRRRRAARR